MYAEEPLANRWPAVVFHFVSLAFSYSSVPFKDNLRGVWLQVPGTKFCNLIDRPVSFLRCGSAVRPPMPDPDFDEQACLQQIAQGDEAAAHELLQHFRPFVLRLVRSHLPRRVSEEDLAQMIFIKVFQNLDRYSGKVPLAHWISRIAVNTCLNELRAEKRRPEWRLADFDQETANAIEQLARTETAIDSPADARLAKEILHQILAQLAPNDRLLITLLHLEERSVQEIHQLTGWSHATIKVRAFRARGRMKKILSQNPMLAPIFTS
jgi:RNA polymerase sigma-70 factor (ECF subfamily)